MHAIDTGSASPEIRYVALETSGEVFAGSSSDVPSRLEEILERAVAVPCAWVRTGLDTLVTPALR
jgi:hypothetical protein